MKYASKSSPLWTLVVAMGALSAPAAVGQAANTELDIFHALGGSVDDPAGAADPDVVSSRPVAIDADALRMADPDASLTFAVPLGNGVSVTALVDRLDHLGGGEFSLSGRLDDNDFSSFVLAGDDQGLFGVFRSFEHGAYQLRLSQSGVRVLREVQGTRSLRCGNDPVTEQLVEQVLRQGSSAPAEAGYASDSGATIDIMVVYTPKAAVTAAVNGYPMSYLINAGIADVNARLDNSNSTPNYRLVFEYPLNTNASNDSGQDRLDLQGKTDGRWDEIHLLRATYAADIVHMVVENISPNLGGLAFRPQDASQLHIDFSYGLTRWNQVDTGTFAHELGHNMACHHHPDDADAAGGTVASTTPVLYPYAFGHRTTFLPFLRTTMAYAAGGYTQISYYSNPDISLTQGGGIPVPIGIVNQRDNAQVIDNTASNLANYTPSVQYVDESQMPNTGKGTLFSPIWDLSVGVLVSSAGHSIRLLSDSDFTGPITDPVVLESATGAPVVIGQ